MHGIALDMWIILGYFQDKMYCVGTIPGLVPILAAAVAAAACRSGRCIAPGLGPSLSIYNIGEGGCPRAQFYIGISQV